MPNTAGSAVSSTVNKNIGDPKKHYLKRVEKLQYSKDEKLISAAIETWN